MRILQLGKDYIYIYIYLSTYISVSISISISISRHAHIYHIHHHGLFLLTPLRFIFFYIFNETKLFRQIFLRLSYL